MVGVIDRFESDFAVIELDNGEIINVAKVDIPPQANEGDVLNICPIITINKEETEKRMKRIRMLTENLWEERG